MHSDDKTPPPRHAPFASPDQPTQIDDAAFGDPDSGRFAPGQRLGPYRIERLLGEGGMGAVYLAEQLEPVQRPVALKLIRGQLRGGLAEAYFLVERQALARMDHPAIAKVYDAGTTPQGFPYFAMEWIDGPTLAAWCETKKPPLRDLIALFVRICRGAQHAHQKGVIHRDLKPSNVLIADVDGQSFPKIIDFGVAVGASPPSGGGTALMYSAGTRGYMSPEQLAGAAREIDIRTDIYALGRIGAARRGCEPAEGFRTEPLAPGRIHGAARGFVYRVGKEGQACGMDGQTRGARSQTGGCGLSIVSLRIASKRI
ncbi:MAG TPA: serine/threonine-protein kinase [Rudaea sp.]